MELLLDGRDWSKTQKLLYVLEPENAPLEKKVRHLHQPQILGFHVDLLDW